MGNMGYGILKKRPVEDKFFPADSVTELSFVIESINRV